MIAIIAAVPVFLLAEDNAKSGTVSVSESARNSLNLLLQSREDINSGEFLAIGYRTVTNVDGRAPDRQPSQITCHFDYPGGRWRYETREVKTMGLTPSSQITPEVLQQIKDKTYSPEQKTRNLIAVFARTPEYMVEWSSYGERGTSDHASPDITIRPADHQPDTFLVHPFSPAACGVVDWLDFEKGRSLSVVLARYEKESERIDSEIDTSGLVNVNYLSGSERRSIQIDPERGYSAVSMRRFMVDESGNAVSGNNSNLESSIAKWEKINNVWVPVRISVSRYVGRGFTHELAYDLDWKSVNDQKFEPALFTYKSFDGVWDGLDVHDRRVKPSLHIDTIGVKNFQTSSPKPGAVTVPVREESRFPVSWIVITNIGIVGVCIALIIVRKVRRFR